VDANELKKLGREGIIEVALKQLQGSGVVDVSTFRRGDFEAKVMASDTKVRVSFKMVPTYIPLNTCFCYGVFMDMTDQWTTYNIIANPEDDDRSDDVPFFNPTEETRKAAAFISDVIAKAYSGERITDEYMIYEREDFYEVMISTEHTDGGYKIDKGSGAIYDDWHKHLIPEPPMDDEFFEEIE
jgi:hypothetical protein